MTQQNVEMGPCRLSINDADVGETLGGVKVRVRTHWRERQSERYGAALVERIALGTEVSLTVRLAEKTLANLQRALPTALSATGHLGLGRLPGYQASSASFSLRLHPEERTDAGRDILLHRAIAREALEVEFGRGRRTFEVEFVALVDPAKTDGDLLARLATAD